MTTKAQLGQRPRNLKEQKKEIDLIMKNVMLTKKLRNMRIEKDLQNTEFELAKQDYFKPVISKIDNVENKMVTFNSDIENKLNAGSEAIQDVHDLQIATANYLREREQNLNDTLNQNQQDLVYQNRLALYSGLPDSTINAIENNEIRIGPIALKYLKGLKDQAYGIHYNDTKQQYFLGNDERYIVNFNFNNIILVDVMDDKEEEEILMTDGLWKLLTRSEIDVESEDEQMYQELAYQYGLMFRSNGSQRSSTSKKWTKILSKSKYLQPKDVVLQRSKFTSKETGGKERINSDPGSTSGTASAPTASTASTSTTSRGIPTAKKTASKLLRRNTIHISPLTSNPFKRLREHESMMNEHAQNIEGDVFTTPDTTLDQSKMDISYGKGLPKIPGITVCGKTGTAENYHNGIKQKDHSVFVLFAPREDPKIVIAVVVQNGGFGAAAAGPIANILLEQYLTDSLRAITKKEVERVTAINLMPKYFEAEQYTADSLRAFNYFRLTNDSSVIRKFLRRSKPDTTPQRDKSKDPVTNVYPAIKTKTVMIPRKPAVTT